MRRGSLHQEAAQYAARSDTQVYIMRGATRTREQSPVPPHHVRRPLARQAQDDELLLEQKDSLRSPRARHRGHTLGGRQWATLDRPEFDGLSGPIVANHLGRDDPSPRHLPESRVDRPSNRHRPAVGAALRNRQALADPDVKAMAWKAQHRLHGRYRALTARGKCQQRVVTAIGRELLGFIWAIGVHVESRTGRETTIAA